MTPAEVDDRRSAGRVVRKHGGVTHEEQRLRLTHELHAVHRHTAPTQQRSRGDFGASVAHQKLQRHEGLQLCRQFGREGLVPETLGRTHATHLSPHMGSISQSVLAVVVLSVFVVLGLDPTATLFTWLTQLGTLAITYLMAFSAIAVLVFFRRHPQLEGNLWKSTIAPAIAAVGLTVLAIYATSQFGFLIGDPESVLAWLLPALIAVAVVVGIVSASMLKSRDPHLFSTMGRDRAVQLTEDDNVH